MNGGYVFRVGRVLVHSSVIAAVILAFVVLGFHVGQHAHQ